MHTEDLSPWQHDHVFDSGNVAGERNTWIAVLITAVMMVVEIVAGFLFNSMALLADGWHMGTHAAALGLTGAAYWAARKYARDTRFSFGTWKIEILGGFASSIVLGIVALYVTVESIDRFFHPVTIRYGEALIVAVIGLIVNLLCALLLVDHGHDHGHGHGHETAAPAHEAEEHEHGHEHEDGYAHDHEHDHDHTHEPDHDHEHGHAHETGAHHDHRDLNLRAAYFHVLADAATSVLAIIALLGGRYFQLGWLDPVMGMVGALMICIWAIGLIRETARILLDWNLDGPNLDKIRKRLEADGDTRISDIHLWRIGRTKCACIIQLVASRPKSLEEYRALLADFQEIGHLVVEINRCPHPH